MLSLAKFVCVMFGVAAVALLGMSLLQPSSLGGVAHVHVSSSSTSDVLLQSAINQADAVARQMSAEAGPQFHSFYISSSAFVSANASAANLQIQGMKNGLMADLSTGAWRHATAPYWMRNGLAGAEQAGSQKTLAAAQAMPISRAVQSGLQRMANAHPSLSAAASGF
jgi:hypothetical protein